MFQAFSKPMTLWSLLWLCKTDFIRKIVTEWKQSQQEQSLIFSMKKKLKSTSHPYYQVSKWIDLERPKVSWSNSTRTVLQMSSPRKYWWPPMCLWLSQWWKKKKCSLGKEISRKYSCFWQSKNLSNLKMFQISFKQSKTAFCLKNPRNNKKLRLSRKKKRRSKKKELGQKTGKLDKLLKRQNRQPVMVKESAFFSN